MNEDLDYNYNGDVIVRKAASPSRARPSALPYALEKLEDIESSARQCAGAGSIGGLNVASLQAAMLRLADQVHIIANEISKEIDTSPEARAGDCDAWLAEFERLLEDYVGARVETGVFNVTQQSNGPLRLQRPRHKALTDYVASRLTTKATP